MPFIIETGPYHHGIKKYATRPHPPSRALVLEGVLADAVRFPTHLDAVVAARRFSSALDLVIVEEKS